MKIIFRVSSLGAGGAERVATTLCNAWAERGDRVTLVPTFSGGGKPFYKVVKNDRLTPAFQWLIPDERCQARRLRYYRKGSARLINSSSPASFGLRGLPGWMIDTWQLSAASTSCR